eukprot:6188468-Pyramimonas_sp.AAC.1
MRPRSAVLGGDNACDSMPLESPVELPMGPQGAACERCVWGLRLISLLGHDALYLVAWTHAN